MIKLPTHYVMRDDHVEEGVRMDCHNCPVSRCVADTVQPLFPCLVITVSAQHSGITVRVHGPRGGLVARYWAPPCLGIGSWMSAFDRHVRRPPDPLTFDLKFEGRTL